jgi:hypothetical protein
MAQQIKKKFIKDDAVDGLKLLLLDGQAVRAKDSGGAAVDLLKLDVDGDVAAKGAKIAYKSEIEELDGRLDIIEGADNVEGSVAKAEKDAKDYADQKVAELVNSAPEVLDTLKELSDALGGDANFSATISGQIGELDGRLDTLEGDALTSGSVAYAVAAEATLRQNADDALSGRLDALEADPVTKTYVDAADVALDARLDALELDSVTKAYVDSADQALDGRLDALELDAVTKAYVDAADTLIDGRVTTLETEMDTAQADIISLDGRMTTAEGEIDAAQSELISLDGRLDIIEGADNVVGSIAKAEKDAKDYADQKVADLVNSAPETLDTLKELSDALGADPNFATTISNQIGGLGGRLDTLEGDALTSGSVAYAVAAEASLREAADQALDARVTTAESDIVALESNKAAIELNNLGVTAINADLLPESDLTKQIGSYELGFKRIVASQMVAGSSSFAFTGDTVQGQNTITNIAEEHFENLKVFQQVSGDGVNDFALISSMTSVVDGVFSIVLDAPCSATASGVSLYAINFLGNKSFDSTTGPSGFATFRSGNAPAKTGVIQIRSGNVTSGTAASGTVTIKSGNVKTGGTSGDVVVQTGYGSDNRGEIKLDGSQVNVNYKKIVNLENPSDDQDGATKYYVDEQIGIANDDISALDVRVGALESATDGPEFFKKKIVMDQAVTLAYVDLDHEAVPNSIVLANGRVMGHLGEDFSHSLEGGVSRLTFINDFASGGVEAVEDGDSIFVTYAVLA